VHCIDNRYSTEQEDQNPQKDEAVNGNNIVVQEQSPGAYGAEPHKDGQIEKHVDGRLQGVIKCLQSEPIAV